jgi:hypothetical protein
MASWLLYKCVDCLDTGTFGPPPSDYCNCKAGKSLKKEIDATFEGCGSCGNIDTEAECHTVCPHYEEDIPF